MNVCAGKSPRKTAGSSFIRFKTFELYGGTQTPFKSSRRNIYSRRDRRRSSRSRDSPAAPVSRGLLPIARASGSIAFLSDCQTDHRRSSINSPSNVPDKFRMRSPSEHCPLAGVSCFPRIRPLVTFTGSYPRTDHPHGIEPKLFRRSRFFSEFTSVLAGRGESLRRLRK